MSREGLNVLVLRRLAGAAFIAFLVLALAVTPLAATFRPGYFDVRYVDEQGSVLLATLQDQTGLVAAVAYLPGGPPTITGTTTRLVLSWIGGCDNPSIYMRFRSVGDRYQLSERSTGSMCFLDIGNGRTFLLQLRAPIDAAAVDIVHE